MAQKFLYRLGAVGVCKGYQRSKTRDLRSTMSEAALKGPAIAGATLSFSGTPLTVAFSPKNQT